MKKLLLILSIFLPALHALSQLTLNCPGVTVIGKTDFETQANYGSSGRLIYEWPNHDMAAVWTFGTNGPTFTDRGTGYNFFDGAWDPIPVGRIESVRTGFPNISGGSAVEEFVFSHSNLNFFKLYRSTHGSGPWLEEPILPMTLFWSRFAHGGANNQTLHVLGSKLSPANGQENPLRYWRSPNNGVTWDLQDVLIPQLDSTHTLLTIPEKNISCRGDVVAIISGGFTDDLILTKSIDNGATWTNTIINQFPIPLYNAGPMITDVNNDGIADTVNTTDASTTLVIDNNNTVHVWVGKNRVLDEDTVSAGGYFPDTDGLLYWNEAMGPNTISNNVIAQMEDLNNDGIISMSVIFFPFNCTATSMASAGINNWNHLFVTYSAYLEDTMLTLPPLPQNRRNVYAMKSTDNGQTWSVPLRVCPEDSVNQLYPSMAEQVYDDPRIIFFRDTTTDNIPSPHHIDVVFISPDISTSLPAVQGEEFQFNVWQPGNQNQLALEVSVNGNMKNAAVKVRDVMGRILFQQPIEVRQTHFTEIINLHHTANGIYLVSLISDTGVKTKKVFFERRE